MTVSNNRMISTIELEATCPEAFHALPECYQNDSCLEFMWDDGILFAYPVPVPGQEHALGNIEGMFINGQWDVQQL